MIHSLKRLWKDSGAQDMVEYALLGGFVALSIFGGFPQASGAMRDIATRVAKLLALAAGAAATSGTSGCPAA
jgi:Flp pilus assembly pilin Flp